MPVPGMSAGSTRCGNIADVDDATNELVEAATSVRERAHCPYSGYAVGVAIRSAEGTIHVGCNVENASYPEGTCAEAGAIAAMVAAGEHVIREVVVVTAGAVPGEPCGGCRQRLNEFAAPDVVVRAVSVDGGDPVEIRLGDLLPYSFGPDHLPD